MIVLFINGEHCTSLEQLKSYFSEDSIPGSDIYADLLDYGRHGDIALWLSEIDESELSSRVESISTGLCDSAFYAQLKAIITGEDVVDSVPLKPAFTSCFSFEDLRCDVNDTEGKVIVFFKVLMCVNEEYVLRVSCNWGMRALMVNPYNYPKGKIVSFDFTFRKRPGKDFGDISVTISDGKDFLQPSVSSSSSSFENETIKDIIKKRGLSQIILALMTAADLQ